MRREANKKGIRVAVSAVALTTAVLLAGCQFWDFETDDGKFTLSESEIELTVGESATLVADTKYRVSWLSEDDTVATVDDSGKVTAVNVGSTVIYAATSACSQECTVTVTRYDPYGSYREGMTLLWSDEFDGDSLNMENWSYQTGTRDNYGGSQGPANWGNNELQSYKEENLTVANGVMTITARRVEEKVDGKSYTSARITGRDKVSTTYGYVEARIQLPEGDGMWPAFWMLPQGPTPYGGWPASGELDIMESKGRIVNAVSGAAHFGKSGGKDSVGANATLSSSISKWHTYALDWQKEYIAWIVDGIEVKRVEYSRWWTGAVSSDENPYAPFDRPFYILFNLAVGGNFDPEGTENLKNNESFTSAQMHVDYVRIYQYNEKLTGNGK